MLKDADAMEYALNIKKWYVAIILEIMIFIAHGMIMNYLFELQHNQKQNLSVIGKIPVTMQLSGRLLTMQAVPLHRNWKC